MGDVVKEAIAGKQPTINNLAILLKGVVTGSNKTDRQSIDNAVGDQLGTC